MTSPEPLVIIGAGGHAKVVCDIARLSGFAVVGFIDTANPGRWGATFVDSTVLGGVEQFTPLARRGVRHAIVAVGDAETRLRLAKQASDAGFVLPVLVHPTAVRAAGVVVGAGSVIAAGAIVCPGTTIGAHVIVNTAASVDHDCVLEDGVHVAVGARLAGGVRVGRGVWIGMGALIRDGVRIGAASVIGAGALVLADLPGGVTAYGSPAKVVKDASGHSSVTR